MTDNKNYPSCNVIGNGKLEFLSSGKTIPFKLISMSAASVLVQMEQDVDTSLLVLIHIVLKSGFFDVRINAEGVTGISSKLDSGYQCEIAFANLSEDDQNEINELMVSSCDLSYV